MIGEEDGVLTEGFLKQSPFTLYHSEALFSRALKGEGIDRALRSRG